MLVLSRKQDERIVIGPNIVITIVRVAGETVRIGIDAPRDVPIYREEVLERIRRDGPTKDGASELVDAVEGERRCAG
ncbi:MAG: carbon storage regulator [Verrucomicrobiae bacterium]|nr:carbon storage regulator [Verrucomicrobiae bacterium]